MKITESGGGPTRVLSATAFLGYGFPEESLSRGVARDPHVIACDAGTNDAGPFYLGAEQSITSYAACKRDIQLMLRASQVTGAVLIIGSAWTSGTDAGVDLVVRMVIEAAAEDRLQPRVAAIYSEQAPAAMEALVREGRVVPLVAGSTYPAGLIEQCSRVVCAMGAEPIIQAIGAGADVIVAGRASDAALFAAGPLFRGLPPERAWHTGRILECGACAADPGDSADCLLAEVTDLDVTIEPLNATLRCTPRSVAAHAMYETKSCLEAREPSGVLDLREAVYEPVGDRAVRISGDVAFRTDVEYSLRVEGAVQRGFRSFCVGGIRDSRFVRDVHKILPIIESDVRRRIEEMGIADLGKTHLRLIPYGLNGVLGALEPNATTVGHEVALMIDVVSETQTLADDVLALARAHTLHADFAGRLNANAGNIAFPFSPSDVSFGPVYEYIPECVVLPDTPTSLMRTGFPAVWTAAGGDIPKEGGDTT